MSERVILVGVETDETKYNFLESMHELAGLTKTAHGEIVFSLTQKRPRIDRQTIIGKGKVEELAQLVDAHEAELVIFNHALTPRQSQTIEERVGVPVIDRIQLILDIFAQRARSKEGKLQVELAQLEYLLPRLTGQGQSLSRLGGGIGTRGPGETKLETDRRHIRRRVSAIKKEVKQDLPTQLVDAFQSTLEESRGMDLLLHVVDTSAEDRQQQEKTVNDLLKDLHMETIPMLTIYNKADRIDEFTFTPTLFPSVLISAKTNRGKELLEDSIKQEIMNLLEPYIVTLNADEGQALSEMKRETLVLSETFDEENEHYVVRGFAKKNSLWIRRMDDELDN